MKFSMCFGLKLGCLCCILLYVQICLAQQTTMTTFDLPVYGIYNRDIPTNGKVHHVSENVYWNSLATAFKQNPQAMMPGIEDSRARLKYQKHLFRDQYGRQFLWDPRYGAIPVVDHNSPQKVHAIPVLYFKTGYTSDDANRQFKIYLPQKGYLIQQYPQTPQDVDCDPDLMPMLSFDDGGETHDPCSGKIKKKSEFGLTATSGMADILCMFCQHINNLQCIWQFCSHPEGVYKIKVKDKTG